MSSQFKSARLQYFIFHKPYGVLSQFTGEVGQKTLADFHLPKNIYAAGRLDKDSEGLLLLTNDGDFIHRLLEPRFAHPRTYWVQVEGVMTDEALKKLCDGVMIQGYCTKPCFAKLLPMTFSLPDRVPPIRYRKNIPTCWIELTLTEGKNRQVRRMTAQVGYPTLRLIRVAMGKLNLGNLLVGQWREIALSELIS
ncbi:MAG: pseudouridine synthase [Verrucomicrobiia bacterium]